MSQRISGAYALAHAAIDSGVGLATSYPGSPATYVINALLKLTGPEQMQVEWTSNEKVAMEVAYGASLGGQRALLCVKGVGLNIALDPLMTLNLAGCNAGFVILVGDDPGGWGSQNEQDSRTLAPLTELPWLEPTTVSDAYAALRDAFSMSEELSLPVLVRVTRALAAAEGTVTWPQLTPAGATGRGDPPGFQREFMRWVVLPVNVVPYHRRLLERLAVAKQHFEVSERNQEIGNGPYGLIASGGAFQKLVDLVDGPFPPPSRVLRLGTLFPLPEERVTAFLQSVDSALVLEETAPFVERGVRDVAQRAGLTLPILGRDTGHIPPTGELFAPHIGEALNRYLPGLELPTQGETGRSRPSREPLCEGCPYFPTFDALQEVMSQRGGRDAFIVVGDPGCMVRAQMEPYKLLDVKHSLGSSLGMAAGISAAQGADGKRVIALCGDSGFLHTGFNGLVDAATLGVQMLVIILDNSTTALSGLQPHPGSTVDTRGRPRQAVDLAGLAREAGAGLVKRIDIDAGENIRDAIESALDFDGLSVVISHGACILL